MEDKMRAIACKMKVMDTNDYDTAVTVLQDMVAAFASEGKNVSYKVLLDREITWDRLSPIDSLYEIFKKLGKLLPTEKYRKISALCEMIVFIQG